MDQKSLVNHREKENIELGGTKKDMKHKASKKQTRNKDQMPLNTLKLNTCRGVTTNALYPLTFRNQDRTKYYDNQEQTESVNDDDLYLNKPNHDNNPSKYRYI
jgi:hypothetical protein